MNEGSSPLRREAKRRDANEEFVARLLARNARSRERYEKDLLLMPMAESALGTGVQLEGVARPAGGVPDVVLETIVRDERPVLFVRDDGLDTDNVTILGSEAQDLVDMLKDSWRRMKPLMPLIGRIDVGGFPGADYLGTGWFADADIVVTNRHVASLIAHWDGRRFVFSRGVGGKPFSASLNTLHEFDDLDPDAARTFEIKEVLYIEPEQSPHDIAFLRLKRRIDGAKRFKLDIASADVGDDNPVLVVGYPARAPRSVIPNQALMENLYRNRFDVKRAAPGFTMGDENGTSRHDCTTLGGNSGAAVLDMKTGTVVGLHFSGLYQEANYAVRATVLRDYVDRKRWSTPPDVTSPSLKPRPETPRQSTSSTGGQAAALGNISAAGGATLRMSAGSVTTVIPLSITVTLGEAGAAAADVAAAKLAPPSAAEAESAVKAFWAERSGDVVAARVGYSEADGHIGDQPHIAASVPASRLEAAAAGGPQQFRGVPIVYYPASIEEQVQVLPVFESVSRVAYDDDARDGNAFSFERVEGETVTVRAHVGPEFSWDELSEFLANADKPLVSAIYEFHASHIKDAVEACLERGLSLQLVMDNASFTDVKDADAEFDRASTFTRWKRKYRERFDRIVAPEGVRGLISDSYHIKVTVSGDRFWLSSGNWKAGSSQPRITQEQRNNAASEDLPGNREWHVVIDNRTLANRFRSHIAQDFKRSAELGSGPIPRRDEAVDFFIDVPIEESVMVLERRPPSRLLEPRTFKGKIKVTPLLTPDRKGEVFAEAVLDLIRSATDSLLFQIPYISMPSNPSADRGFIDELIAALTEKLLTLRDARVILRVGGSGFSDPTHAAWHFKSKGVDIENRLRRIENHHTKGMIVDGKHTLIGSHNWSRPGVSLNRDASLVFHDHKGIAEYFAEAFEIDWDRANPIRPRRHVTHETVVREAVGPIPPTGYRRMRLSELLKDD